MMNWSLSAEMLAFVITVMLALFSCGEEQTKSVRRKIFHIALVMTALSTIVNGLSVYLLEHATSFPYGLVMGVNSLYFLVSVAMSTTVAVYMFELLLEHVYNKICRVRATVGLSLIVGIFLILLITNIKNGCLFWVDSQGMYHRGPFNWIGYAVLMGEMALVLICYIHNRSSVEKRIVRVMRTLPVIVLLMTIFQIAFPELLLNGTIGAFSCMIIFMNFQNMYEDKDSLTESGNRKSFFEELALRQKSGQKFQIVMVSLKNFEIVNQRFGYRRGDEFLYNIANWLDSCRKEGRVFRFSNVTFALLSPYVDAEESRELLEEVEMRFRMPWVLGEVQYTFSPCFGGLGCNPKGWEATEIVELLSFMMEYVKETDQNTVEFSPKIEHMFQQKKNLTLLLRDSIDKKRFEVWYQPIYDCNKKKFVTAEALLRLRDYTGHMVSPADFIPLAEETGMIEEIGWFVWEDVCRFLGKHKELSLESVSVNMSMQQFMNPMLFERIEDCLYKNQISADKIKMEITERVILADTEYMKRLMEEYSPRGLQFCMDDFGTGYSNFSSVMHLPFEFVKLDRSLLKGLPEREKDMLIVESMIELFHNMGSRIVAEGIETEEQQRLLSQMGVDYIQGYYYAKPMPEQELVRFLKQ